MKSPFSSGLGKSPNQEIAQDLTLISAALFKKYLDNLSSSYSSVHNTHGAMNIDSPEATG
jgi:hypothetical protein